MHRVYAGCRPDVSLLKRCEPAQMAHIYFHNATADTQRYTLLIDPLAVIS